MLPKTSSAQHPTRDLYLPLDPREILKKDITFQKGQLGAAHPKRILLVTPPGSIEIVYGKLAKAATELPWLGMAYVAAAARECGHEVLIRDYEAMRLGYDALVEDLKRFRPDVVAMATFVTHTERCLNVAKLTKEANPNILIVLGGPQATIFPTETILLPEIDVVIRSEAEISFNRLLQSAEDPTSWSEIKGLVYKGKDGEITMSPSQPLISDLDSLPPPALDLYDMHLYYPAIHIRGRRVANYVTSRGCPFECTYCEAKMTFGRTFRYHSTQRVTQDIDYLIRQYGFDGFQFYDDLFTTNRNRVIDLCEGFLRMGRKFQWMCWSRTDLLDREMLQLMKRSGCYLINFGCESGDQEMLDRIKKKLTVEENRAGLALTHECGIQTMSSFMIGLPGETSAQSRKTIDFALESKLDYAAFNVFEPYPGTEIWQDAVSNGSFIEDPRFKNAILQNLKEVWVPHNRSREEIINLLDTGYRRFYLRPRAIWSWVKNIPHLGIRRVSRALAAGFEFLFLDRLPFYKSTQGASKRYS
jgi:radical SAM superfamily enzyme YgiQ (UPF0313 family)